MIRPLAASDPRSAILRSPARFRVHVAGRRSGKTVLNAMIAALGASERPGALVWYVTPDWKQVSQFVAPLLELVPGWAVQRYEPSRSRVTFRNGSAIECRNATHQDRLRGHGLDLVVVDEYQDVSAHLFDSVLRPALADRQGRAVISGTPKGTGSAFHRVWSHGQDGLEGWASWRYTARDTHTPAEQDMLAARVDAEARGPTALKQWRREWEADWTAFVGQVFEVWDPRKHVTPERPRDRLRAIAGVDWGFSDSHPGVVEVLVQTRDGRWHVVEEVAATGKVVAGWWVPQIQALARRWGVERIYCDPAAPGYIAEVRRGVDPAVAVREADNSVHEGVVHLATLLEGDKLRVHESCELLLEQVPSYRWEERRDGTMLEKPLKAYDDAVDALRYALYSDHAMPRAWAS